MRRIGMALALAASPLIASCGETPEETAPVEEVVDTRTPEERVESIVSSGIYSRRCNYLAEGAGDVIRAEEYSDKASLSARENYFARQDFNEARAERAAEAEQTAKDSCFEDRLKSEADGDATLEEQLLEAYRSRGNAEATPS